MPHDQPGIARAIRASGRRLTSQRSLVLGALHDLPGHSTAEQIYDHVRAHDGACDMALSTVYRNLDALVEMGLVAAFASPAGPTTYEWAAEDAHHHLLCDRCGHTEEVELHSLGVLAREVEEGHGFAPDIRHLAIHGECAACRTGEATR